MKNLGAIDYEDSKILLNTERLLSGAKALKRSMEKINWLLEISIYLYLCCQEAANLYAIIQFTYNYGKMITLKITRLYHSPVGEIMFSVC